MKTLAILVKRNIKLFFKDKGLFLTSLITPMILLVLYITFLGSIYEQAFISTIPSSIIVDERIINGIVGGQLISSILAVSCITVSFCSNFLMVQDRANGSLKDFTISPIKPSILSLSYYISSFISTLIICLTATIICLIYIWIIGWYFTIVDVLLIFLDVILLVMFGTALSSVVNHFLSSMGQISAVGTIVSSGYGFICGAYMPISNFSPTLQKVIGFLPGTYGTGLIRNHSMISAYNELEKSGVPSDLVNGLKDALDVNLYFYGNKVELPIMYLILIVSTIILVITYIFINRFKNRKSS